MSALRDVIYKYKDKFNNLNSTQAENAAKGRWFEASKRAARKILQNEL